MTSFAYTVRTTLPRGDVFAAWVAWLSDEHVAHVCAAGAEDAVIVVLDEPDAPRATETVECRYTFASREAFATYERLHAPRLREGGLAFLARLGVAPGEGATFARTTGVVRACRR